MKRLFAAILILCMIPAVSCAFPVRESREALFSEWCDVFELPECSLFQDGALTYLFFDGDECYGYVRFTDSGSVFHASLTYSKPLDFDFITYGLGLTFAFFGTEYEEVFLLTMVSFQDGKGFYISDDDSVYMTITRKSPDEITLLISKR